MPLAFLLELTMKEILERLKASAKEHPGEFFGDQEWPAASVRKSDLREVLQLFEGRDAQTDSMYEKDMKDLLGNLQQSLK